MSARVPVVAAVAACGILACFLTLTASAAPAPGFAYRSLGLGANSTCAITTAGAAKCWGFGDGGALGNRTRPGYASRVPVNVAGLSSGVAALASGLHFVCALTRAGAVKCWGAGANGQLGNGTAVAFSNTPVDVTGLSSGVRSVAAGLEGACAVTSAGGVKCWGGGLAAGSPATQARTPIDVVGLTSGVRSVAYGQGACAITTSGGVKCWRTPVLGDGSRLNAGGTSPVDVSGLSSGVKAIAVGQHQICALTSAGGVKCWGQNTSGQVGTGTATVAEVLTPVDVLGLTSGVTAIASGGDHTCAIAAGGVVKCWGRNQNGELGIGRLTPNSPRPVDVVGLGSGVRAIGAGQDHSCAIDRNGVTKCWGSNAWESAGLALPTRVSQSATPRPVYRQEAPRATTPRSATFARFLSPSRNLSCELSDRASGVSVYCQSLNKPHSVRMSRTGAYTVCRGVRCLGDPAPGTRPLAYGRGTTVGRFTCRSLMAGIRCTVTSTGKGFLIDKEGVTRVG